MGWGITAGNELSANGNLSLVSVSQRRGSLHVCQLALINEAGGPSEVDRCRPYFIGLLGEYIGSIHTQVHKRPLVVEKERINFRRDTDGFHRDADGFHLAARDDSSPAKERVNSLR